MPVYESIEKIQIDAYEPGRWKNAVIFAIDFDIGFGDAATKLVMSVVNVPGIYEISEQELSYLVPHDIQFGPFRFRFYLESYRIQKAAGKRVLQLTFVDGSTLLDRIYVALQDRDRKVPDWSVEQMPVSFPVLCPRPEFYPPALATNNLVNLSKVAIMPIKHVLMDPNSLLGPNIALGGRLEEGGMITVGMDFPSIENVHQDCSIREAKYTFFHLLFRIEQWGIKVKGDFLRKDAAGVPLVDPITGGNVYADRNPYHFESFGGQTLREVLNTWCKMQGYTWTYDWMEQAIIGVDMYASTGWAEFEDISVIVENVRSQLPDGTRADALIEQATETVSIADTKAKYVTTKAIRSAKPDQPTNQDYYRPIKFWPLDTAHIIAPNQRGRITGIRWTGFVAGTGLVTTPVYRTNTDLHISCGFARYKGSGGMAAREIFNVAIGCHEATGVEILAEIHPYKMPGGNAPAGIMAMNNFLLGQSPEGRRLLGSMASQLRWNNFPFRFYFARFNKKSKTAWEKWEEDIAKTFMGQYYVNFDRMHNFEACDPRGFGVFRRTDTVALGDGQSLGGANFKILTKRSVGSGATPFPFNNVLKDPYGLRINPNLFVFFNRFNLLIRNEAAFETSDKDIADLLKPVGIGVLDQWRPIFLKVGKNQGVLQWIGKCFPHVLAMGGVGTNFVMWGSGLMTGLGSGMSANQIFLAIQAQMAAAAKSDAEIGIYVHPDYQNANFPFSIWDVDYTRYENLKERNITQQSAFGQNSYLDTCPLLCGGISPRQQLCDGLMHLFKPRPWPSGLERRNMGGFPPLGMPYWTLPALGFGMSYDVPPAVWTDPWILAYEYVIFPTWTTYAANHKSHQYRRVLEPKMLHIINSMEEAAHTPGNVAKVEVIPNDVSGMIDTQLTGDLNIRLPMGSANPLLGGAWLPELGKNKLWDTLTIRKLHNDYSKGMEVDVQNFILAKPRKTLSCTVAGMGFGTLLPYIKQGGALEAVSIQLGKDGVKTELKFSNRPPATLHDEIGGAKGAHLQTDLFGRGGFTPMY